ncbi:MAG: DUF2336 domain-containing protein [Afipia sp.]|jgi:uncharacterized protein (DUF2336 family)|nr:DUF2336 domain-containing protein [Afipia sp.]
MAAAFSLIPELDDIVRNGTPARRARAIGGLSDLFLKSAASFGTEHVALFDDILLGLIPATPVEIRADLAVRLAALVNAPPTLVKQFAHDGEIRIAGPILSLSPLLDDPTLIDIASRRGQEHLAAISDRSQLSTPLTDVIVRRGDRDVVRSVAANAGARFSDTGYSGLVRRAVDDGMLAVAVGRRDDVPAPVLKRLLAESVDVVRRRLFEGATPAQKATINQAMLELSGAPKARLGRRDFTAAQRTIIAMKRAGELDEAALLDFARQHKYEEAVAAVAMLSGMELAAVNQLVLGERYDPILILGKSLGFAWATACALIVLRLGPGKGASPSTIEEARLNYERLSPATAQRVLAFWRLRGASGPRG